MRRGVVVGLLAVLSAACTIMNGLKLDAAPTDPTPGDDDDDIGPGPNKDGGPKDDGAVSQTGCNLRHAPPKPRPATGGTDRDLVFAMQTMDSTPDPEGAKGGLDLDGLCTCTNNEPPACQSKTGETECDLGGQAGVDNIGAKSFAALLSQTGGFNMIQLANGRIANGQHGHLFKIAGYNGLKDDDDVKVTFHPSPGRSGVNFGVVQDWPFAPGVIAREAYVAGGVLVAKFDEIQAFIFENTFAPPSFNSATLLGEIKDVNGTLRLPEAQLVGRVNTTALLAAIGEFDTELGGPICYAAPTQYQAVGSLACNKADLPSDPSKDKTNAPCDSFSMVIRFSTVPATLGSESSIPGVGPRCDPSDRVACQ